jgi:para-aminobenzoate synthetase/4-amino-4-deoxychorismate lyase
MTAWMDGVFVGDSAVPMAKSKAPGPFETMGAVRGDLPLWRYHIARLASAAARLGLPFTEDTKLRAAAVEVLLHGNHTDDVLRLALVPDGAVVHTVLQSRARGPRFSSLKLLPTVVQPPAAGPPRDLKVWPRPYYDAVRQQAQDGGADDGVVVDPDGSVLETAIGNLWLRLDGRWVTPPLDGRVLPGIARAVLLRQAAKHGLPVEERRVDLGDLHRAEALARSNAVWGPLPAVLLGSRSGALAHRPTVGHVDTELAPLWSLELGD